MGSRKRWYAVGYGRYFIFGQNGFHAGEEANTQNGEENIQFAQANAHVDSHESHANSQERNGQQALIDRLTSEVDYLRDQLDKQTHLLAASTAALGKGCNGYQSPVVALVPSLRGE